MSSLRRTDRPFSFIEPLPPNLSELFRQMFLEHHELSVVSETSDLSPKPRLIVLALVVVLIVHPKLFIEPGTKAFFQLSSLSGPGL